MKHTYYKKFNEHLYYQKLDNGLDVYLVPKPEYHKVFATFTTNYGAIDLSFIPHGSERKVTQPAGIAHFLEHKMFAMPDKTDAFETLSNFGVSANAFTSMDKTSYLFSGTENIKEAVNYLLDYVQTPYFTKSSVIKEQGIIAEELLMYLDNPPRRIRSGLLRNLYKKHPIRIEGIGTMDSIYKITPHRLYQAYNSFYHPSNMNFILTGNFDQEEMFELIKANQASKNYEIQKPVEKIFPKEQLKVANSEETIEMSIGMPYVGVGVKLPPKGDLKEQYRTSLVLQILLDLYLSNSSDDIQKLLKAGIINQSFSYYPLVVPNIKAIIISSMTANPEAFKTEISKLLVNLKRRKISETEFEIYKKSYYGSFIRSLNSLENISFGLINTIPYGINLFEIPELIQTIEIADLVEQAKEIKRDRIATFTIMPKKV
ncbi:MAG: insulinase family protein [Acholeplasmataceae bacterium]|nr:insulinase family protein [Acholeplasmataceae bacterium]